jgi:RNA polymerase sigma-70 factor (ECF subfamily)
MSFPAAAVLRIMSSAMPRSRRNEDTAVIAAATAGDEGAFAALVDRHRRELHVHCYRMLASFEEAEDAVQETFLRAWNRRATFAGGPGFRAWLYTIATNACIDAQRRTSRQLTTLQSFRDIPWLQPYPDRLLDELAAADGEPDAIVVAKETIELTFLAAIQLLPARQRAALLLRDVLGWSAAETATLLETSVAAANSALQRARATLQEHLPERRLDWTPPSEPTAGERELLARLLDAHERQDAAASIALLREDVRITMPPLPMVYNGLDEVTPLLEHAFGAGSHGDWRLVEIRANRTPAAASYLRAHGDTEFRAFKIDVIRLEQGRVAEMTTFGTTLFDAFGLPPVLPAEHAAATR